MSTTLTRGIEAPDYDDIRPRDLWSEILPGLWQGGTDDDDIIGNDKFAKPFKYGTEKIEAFITKEDFDAVVTLYQYANPVGWFVNEYRYGFYDAKMSMVDLNELRNAVDYAYNAWKAGKEVLIRCQAGLNRSGLVTALVLIKDGYDPVEAISLIRDKRSPNALFNLDFERWLVSLDVEAWRN